MIKNQQKGFSSVVGLIAILVVLVGLAGWSVMRRNDNNKLQNIPTSQNSQNNSNNSNQQVDPSEDGKYLFIKEWGVRVKLTSSFSGKATYSLGNITADPDGNNIQAAKVFIAKTSLTDNKCAVTNTSLGESVDSAAQYIRSQNSKPFNASRYRWTFKEDILKEDNYSYHLNYVTPDCAGGDSNATKIEELQTALAQLTKVED